MNALQKYEQVKLLIKAIKEDVTDEEIGDVLCQCSCFYKKIKKKEMSDFAKKVYEVLVRNGYNPSTPYTWIRFQEYPDYIKQKLKFGQISEREAIRLWRERKQINSEEYEQKILADIVEYMKRFRKKYEVAMNEY